ncbi:MAG TPA: hypothetical protein VLA74_11170 [Nitrososphaeraceae archaeon]|nr:hypothetical protein [Nitrososphaeraceae archaeon]
MIRSLVEKNDNHIVYPDGGTWYDEACNLLRLKHYLHSQLEREKSNGKSQSAFQR